MISATVAVRVARLMIARCSGCHSTDLITQQRLSRARWEATIEKMKHWGAQISTDEADLLVQYLSASYHPDAPNPVAPLDHERGKAEPLRQEGTLGSGSARREEDVFVCNCQICDGTGASGGRGPKLAKTLIFKREDLFWETVPHGRKPMLAWSAVLSD